MIGVIMQGEKSCTPDWFIPLLEEWGIEYGRGKVVDLSARSGTQVLWGKGRARKGFNSSDSERALVNKAFEELRKLNEYAAGMIQFVYLSGKRKSMCDVEECYRLSNRAAGQEVSAAESLMYNEFMRFKRVA